MSDYKHSHHIGGRITEVTLTMSGAKMDFQTVLRFRITLDEDRTFAVCKGAPLRKAQVNFLEGETSRFGELSYFEEWSSDGEIHEHGCDANFRCSRLILDNLMPYRHEYIGGWISLNLSEDQKAIRFVESFSPDECGLEWNIEDGPHVPISDFAITLRYNGESKTLERGTLEIEK